MNISNELLNALLSYLGKKPYQESAQLISQMQKEIQEQQKVPEKKIPELKEVKK